MDFSVLERLKRFRRKGGTDPLVEMIDLFLKDMPVDLRHLTKAIDEKNNSHIEDLVHGIKSSAANVGAIRISEIAREMEELCRKHHFDQVYPMLSELKEACTISRNMLMSYKESDSV